MRGGRSDGPVPGVRTGRSGVPAVLLQLRPRCLFVFCRSPRPGGEWGVERLRLTGSTLRTRNADFKAGLLARMEEKLWPLFETGKLKPLVARTYPFDQVDEAFDELARDRIVGKIVLVND